MFIAVFGGFVGLFAVLIFLSFLRGPACLFLFRGNPGGLRRPLGSFRSLFDFHGDTFGIQRGEEYQFPLVICQEALAAVLGGGALVDQLPVLVFQQDAHEAGALGT